MANEETSGVAALKGKRRKNQLRRKGGGRRELEQGPMMETRRGKGFPGAERAGGQRQAVGLGSCEGSPRRTWHRSRLF